MNGVCQEHGDGHGADAAGDGGEGSGDRLYRFKVNVSDEFGFAAVENKVHVHDLHATMLQLLGFDHEKLTFRYNGRDFRLTDVYGSVVKGIMA